MDLSESSDDDISSDDQATPAKRARTDTLGGSSITSQGSGVQDSDDDESSPHNSKETRYNDNPKENLRLSTTSYENGSSPSQADDYRPGFDNLNDSENGDDNYRPSFQSSGDTNFYNKSMGDDTILQKYSEKSRRMMSKMGHKFGKGLGKREDGRVAPVKASTQKGKRGLGIPASAVAELPKDLKWNPDEPQGSPHETVEWMPSPPSDVLSGDELEVWLQRGPKKLTIDDETEFVEPHILEGVLTAKKNFDTLHDEDLRQARFRSNPFETIGSVIFLNRAAVKMANMDAVFDFMFTDPKRPDGSSVLGNTEILYFADVCAGPGGFSEYVLYRKKWKAKGFGFTLKKGTDFKLQDFYAGPPETFNTFYGVKNDGDIYDPANLDSLKEYVLKQTDDMGVHFLMADGGFSVEGKENIQEILSKQLYLCQCIAALMLVRTGGHFVVKLFDVFTPFTVGLLYIMYRCFEKVCIHKPVTSRPANSERYLICKWKKVGTDSVERHLLYVNTLLHNGLQSDEDITELVPLSVIKEDQDFFDYIYRSNNALGEIQIKNLHKIAAFSKDETLYETSQSEIRRECLKLWNIPDEMRKQPERLKPDDTLSKILSLLEKANCIASSAHSFKDTVLNKEPDYLETPHDMHRVFKSVFDWYYMYLSGNKKSPDVRIFIGCGGKQVYKLERNKWTHVVELTLPAKTLIYGEITNEFNGEGVKQKRNKVLHIIDALMLGGEDISHLRLPDRNVQCTMFCNALEKPPRAGEFPIRCKKLFPLERFPNDIEDLEYRKMKAGKTAVTIKTPERNNYENFNTVGSIIFIKEMKEPWFAHRSSRSNKLYYNMSDRKDKSTYEFPEGGALDMVSAYSKRVLWPWEPRENVIFEGKPTEDVVTKTHMIEYINIHKAR